MPSTDEKHLPRIEAAVLDLLADMRRRKGPTYGMTLDGLAAEVRRCLKRDSALGERLPRGTVDRLVGSVVARLTDESAVESFEKTTQDWVFESTHRYCRLTEVGVARMAVAGPAD